MADTKDWFRCCIRCFLGRYYTHPLIPKTETTTNQSTICTESNMLSQWVLGTANRGIGGRLLPGARMTQKGLPKVGDESGKLQPWSSLSYLQATQQPWNLSSTGQLARVPSCSCGLLQESWALSSPVNFTCSKRVKFASFLNLRGLLFLPGWNVSILKKKKMIYSRRLERG